jgi:hypothetical protein
MLAICMLAHVCWSNACQNVCLPIAALQSVFQIIVGQMFVSLMSFGKMSFSRIFVGQMFACQMSVDQIFVGQMYAC